MGHLSSKLNAACPLDSRCKVGHGQCDYITPAGNTRTLRRAMNKSESGCEESQSLG